MCWRPSPASMAARVPRRFIETTRRDGSSQIDDLDRSDATAQVEHRDRAETARAGLRRQRGAAGIDEEHAVAMGNDGSVCRSEDHDIDGRAEGRLERLTHGNLLLFARIESDGRAFQIEERADAEAAGSDDAQRRNALVPRRIVAAAR